GVEVGELAAEGELGELVGARWRCEVGARACRSTARAGDDTLERVAGDLLRARGVPERLDGELGVGLGVLGADDEAPTLAARDPSADLLLTGILDDLKQALGGASVGVSHACCRATRTGGAVRCDCAPTSRE